MGHKAADTTCNIGNTFGPGTAKEHTMQYWFKTFCQKKKKTFCKGDDSLEGA